MDFRKAARDPWVWGQLLLIGGVALLPLLLPKLANFRVDPVWIRSLGGVAIAAGVALTVWGVRSLGPGLTPGIEPLPDAPLVVTGAYTHLRHPIYAGVALMLAGYTLAWSTWTLALAVGAIALVFFGAKARAEERWLLVRYPAYRRYALHVTRRPF